MTSEHHGHTGHEGMPGVITDAEYGKLRGELERLRTIAETALTKIARLPRVNSERELDRRGQELRLNEQARAIAEAALAELRL